MKSIAGFILAVIFAFSAVLGVHAQAAESIWLAASNTAYKTGETVTITVNANSVTPIQGFTFQIRYDPACLQPINATSPITGMNGLPLPQTTGLVDASFASTTPHSANGVLAEVHFLTLGGCQTNLTLEDAGLAIRNAEGFAAELPGITLGERDVALLIDKAAGVPSTQIVSGTPLPLGPPLPSDANDSSVIMIILMTLLAVGGIFVILFGVYKFLRR